MQHPSVQFFFERKYGQLAQIAAQSESVQHVVPKRRYQGRGCFAVQFLEKTVAVASRTEDIASSRLDSLLLIRGFWILCVLVLRIIGLHIVRHHEGRHSVNTVVGYLPTIAFRDASEMQSVGVVLRSINCRAAVERVGHGLHYFRVAAEANGRDGTAVLTLLSDDCFRISGQLYAVVWIKIFQFNQIAF